MTFSTCVEMTCQVNGNTDVPSQSLSAGGISCSDKNYNGYGSSGSVTGWMYTNEQGQMCGPYIQEQLFEGLSTGFLPDDLPVYPVINGTLLNPVLLKFFKLYPDHVATGFVHLHGAMSVVSSGNCHIPVKDSSVNCTQNPPNSSQRVHVSSNSYSFSKASDLSQPIGIAVQDEQSLSWQERCWLFEDGYGTTNGPHTLSELYYWHQCGYLSGSVMIRHTENKFSPFTFVSLINTWRQRGMSASSETTDSLEFINEISEMIGSELHNGIMKAARRFVLDEIIGNTIVDFAAMKKAQKHLKKEAGVENAKTCCDDSGKSKDHMGARHDTMSQSAAIKHDNISSLTCSPNRTLAEFSAPQHIRSVGSFVNFKEAIVAVKQVLFDGCEPVLWNAVFYDHVTNHVLAWRKRRRWTYINIGGSTVYTDSHKTTEEQIVPVDPCSSSHELDCPPGFHPMTQNLSCIPPSPCREDKHALSCAQQYDCDQEEIISKVQNDLFTAAKTAMVDLLRKSAEEEAYLLIKSLKDNETDKVGDQTDAGTSEVHTVSEIAQGLNSGSISIDDLQLPMQESKQSNHLFVFSRKRSRYDFLGSGFKRLGAPVRPAIDNERTDEPPPPGLTTSKTDSCDHQSLMQLPGCSQTPLGEIRSVRENCYDFVGSAFRRLGKPKLHVVDDQQIDGTPPSGAENGINNVACVNSCKARPSGSSERILKCEKFVALAMCRQELHDTVLREWKSSFDDSLLSQLLSSCFSPKKRYHHQPENEDIMERLRSCHSSGPSEVSVTDKVTYSRKKKLQKRLRAEPDSPTLGDMKLYRQSLNKFGKQKNLTNVSGQGTSGVRNVKPKENGVYPKPTESDTGTSKGGTSNKRKLSENQPSTMSSGSKKLPKLTGTSKGKASVGDGSIGMEKVKDVKVIPNDTPEHSGRNTCNLASHDEGADIQSQGMQQANKNKKLKRKLLMNDSSPHMLKDTNLMIANTTQAACKKGSKKGVSKSKSKVLSSCPLSVGCARTSINGWDWHKWSLNARPAERARVRGIQITTMQRLTADVCVPVASHVKGISARTNRVKMRNLLAAAEGAELLKASQLKARKKRLRFQRSKIHDWGLVALEPIETDDFVIEYVGELIRPRISDIRELQYEKMGIGSSYLFRLDDGYVVDATKRGGIARFINHSCEPNCYTKIVPVEGQKRIFIYAKRHIAAGEEITYDYKFPLEEKKIPCNCGSKRCRGSMN